MEWHITLELKLKDLFAFYASNTVVMYSKKAVDAHVPFPFSRGVSIRIVL